jgi:hypothetical protein
MTSSPLSTTNYYNAATTPVLPPSPKTETLFPMEFLTQRSLCKTRILAEILNRKVSLVSKTNDVKLVVSLFELLNAFKNAFMYSGIALAAGGIKLIGSTASAVVLDQECAGSTAKLTVQDINDMDFSFHLESQVNFADILRTQEYAICALLREKCNVYISAYEAYSMFFNAAFCIDNDMDKWSLISLGSDDTTVDIKTVYTLSRSYAFTMDSFEIELDGILQQVDNYNLHKHHTWVDVKVHSNYHNFAEALYHLHNRIIYTENIGNMHHGLFRYCLEIARGNRCDSLLYEVVLVARFWEEFGNIEIKRFTTILSNFVSKHKKNWFCILTQMHYIISRYPCHPRVPEFMETIFKLMFSKTAF